MTCRSTLVATLAAALAIGAAAPAAALVATLYDPALGTLPAAQGWRSGGNGAPGQRLDGGRYEAATLPDLTTSFGSARRAPIALDTAAGFVVDFDLRVVDERHATPNRAGFSFIVTGDDPRRSIEVAFWSDRVWAYAYDAADPDRFVHGVEARFDTASAALDYALTLRDQRFSLTSGGRTLLAGELVDYTAQGAPYVVPNFIFFGDDSSRAGSDYSLGAITLAAVPEPSGAALLAVGIAICAGAARRSRGRR